MVHIYNSKENKTLFTLLQTLWLREIQDMKIKVALLYRSIRCSQWTFPQYSCGLVLMSGWRGFFSRDLHTDSSWSSAAPTVSWRWFYLGSQHGDTATPKQTTETRAHWGMLLNIESRDSRQHHMWRWQICTRTYHNGVGLKVLFEK